jgi:pantetheine-phosphate adenylyltransferase
MAVLRSCREALRYPLLVEVGLYAGSFDPVHLGHLDLITAASEELDRLVVVVAANTEKRAGMFPIHERVEMLAGACRHLGNVRVTAHGGLLIQMAGRIRADVLVRSAGKEHVDEKEMAYMNGCEGLPTVLIPSNPQTAFISSAQVRDLIGVGALDAVADLVPSAVLDVLNERERKHRQGRSQVP